MEMSIQGSNQKNSRNLRKESNKIQCGLVLHLPQAKGVHETAETVWVKH